MTYLGIEKAFQNSVKAQKFINIVATIGTVLMICIAFVTKNGQTMDKIPVVNYKY